MEFLATGKLEEKRKNAVKRGPTLLEFFFHLDRESFGAQTGASGEDDPKRRLNQRDDRCESKQGGDKFVYGRQGSPAAAVLFQEQENPHRGFLQRGFAYLPKNSRL